MSASYPTSVVSIDNLEAWDDTLVGTTKDIAFAVPASSPYTYAPIYKHKTENDVTVCTGSGAGGTCLTREYTGTPAAGQFYINPNNSILTFNVAQAGVSYYVRFTSLGSYVKVAWHNVIADEVEAIERALKSSISITMVSTSSYAFGANYETVLFDATSNEITTTLPLATESYGKRYTTKKIDGSSNKVIITGTGTDKIDFSHTYELEFNNQFATVVCGGTCWSIVATG